MMLSLMMNPRLGAKRWVTLALALIAPFLAGPARAAQTVAPLGSPGFRPTPEQPVGWRGDGTGRYPGATPPL